MTFSRSLSRVVEVYPPAYLWLQRLRYSTHRDYGRLISRTHHITIEGFPRCANSYAHRAFLIANAGMSPTIATHFHSPVQIMLSSKWGVPTLVLTREPTAAVTSLVAYQENISGKQLLSRELESEIKSVLKRYIYFYLRILPLKDNCVVSDFSTTTEEFHSVVQAINSRYETNFKQPESSNNAREEIFSSNGVHLSPNPNRSKRISEIKSALDSFQMNELEDRAGNLYSAFKRVAV